MSASSRQTRIRDSNAAFTSKYGFSVVAPIERHGPVLDVRQEGVLLGLVEAMDLVEEQDRPRSLQGQPFLGLGDRRPDLDDAGHDRGHGREVGADLARQQPREAGLAGPGRSPQQERGEMTAGDAPTERPSLADEVVLADELRRGTRGRMRAARGWRSGGGWKRASGRAPAGRRAGGMAAMVARAARRAAATVDVRRGPPR